MLGKDTPSNDQNGDSLSLAKKSSMRWRHIKRTTHLAHFLDTPLVSLSHVPHDCQWGGGVAVATPPDLAMNCRIEEVQLKWQLLHKMSKHDNKMYHLVLRNNG